jgi:hypothetical protein
MTVQELCNLAQERTDGGWTEKFGKLGIPLPDDKEWTVLNKMPTDMVTAFIAGMMAGITAQEQA